MQLSEIKWSDCVEIEPLAVGGMAATFLAERTNGSFKKKIVIKKILDQYSQDEVIRALFAQEAERHAQLVHPNIVELLDFGYDSDNLYMALEYVSCGNLRNVSMQIAHYSPAAREAIALRVLQQIAEALRRVHQQFIHQDLSPANILYAGEGHFKLCDFGLAKDIAHEPPHGSRLRQGKLRYMAPEQIARSYSDVRTDIFSLGVTVAEFYSGSRLYGNLEPEQISKLVRSGDYLKHLRDINLPPSLSEIVFMATQPAANDRFQSAEELLAALKPDHPPLPSNTELQISEIRRPPKLRKWSVFLSLILTLPTLLFLPWVTQWRKIKRT